MTLVELLVVMVLSLVVLGVAGGTVVHGMRTQRREVATVDALAGVRTAFERVTRDLRGANPVVTASATTATARSTVDGRVRTVTYRLVADRLRVDERVEDAATGSVLTDPPERTLLRGVQLPAGASPFTWASADGTALASPADPEAVARVTVRLRVPVGHGSRSVDLSSDVVLRNKER